ncbi:hypothetical protein NPIL_354621 [Nephila pilipes]|uniref:Uncharacterized protein n=1 Tax=Nephila pilipes TaxID=299642 RepID=A0A8X6NZE6_NEPPI|nr:hypothetical protein NPIL_354621 [Nephila pilipes]
METLCCFPSMYNENTLGALFTISLGPAWEGVTGAIERKEFAEKRKMSKKISLVMKTGKYKGYDADTSIKERIYHPTPRAAKFLALVLTKELKKNSSGSINVIS